MSKGILMLNFFILSQNLRKLCKTTGASYKYCHAVAQELTPPSFKLMKQLSPYINPIYWFQIATNEDYLENKKRFKI